MAYTYKEFIGAANRDNKLRRFSEQDLQVAQRSPEYGLGMLRLMQDYDQAGTEESKLLAEAAMEQLRSSYGAQKPLMAPQTATGAAGGIKDVSLANMDDAGGGSTVPANGEPGKETTALIEPTRPEQAEPAAPAETGFQWDNEEAYQQLLAQMAGQHGYSSNPDKSTAAFRNAYRREGERATANALAQAAALTGGVPSSYAVSAAQQAGAYYAAQLAEKEAELEQQAYDRYLTEQQLNMDKLDALRADRADDYSIYMNQIEAQRLAEETGTTTTAAKETSVREEDMAEVLARYPDGAVTYAQDWYDLLDRYSYDALAAAGISYKEAAVGDEELAIVKELYPDGKVTHRSFWESLLNDYTEKALEAAGLVYVGN